MPNRLVREGFLDSEAINSISDAAECLFHRLMLAVDDAGRMDGRVDILRARLFPLDLSRRASDVEAQLLECVQKGLVMPYTWDGKPFLQIVKWQRCSPCQVSKYPWTDGSFRIAYQKRDTRDGIKEFVTSSLSHADAIPIPSGRDLGALPKIYGDGDGDGDGDESARSTEAKIPSMGEFITSFMSSGIPPEYLEQKWAWFEGNNAWLDKNGKAKNYRVLVSSWWAKDRGTWVNKPVKPNPKAADYSDRLVREAQ